MNTVRRKIEKNKRIALIAHDNMKGDLIEWCAVNKNVLSQNTLCGTGTTATLIEKYTGLSVYAYNSGPLGGDPQLIFDRQDVAKTGRRLEHVAVATAGFSDTI